MPVAASASPVAPVASSSPSASAAPAKTPRLVSLDALRGFDMFWILGGDALILSLPKVWDIAPLRMLAEQFDHKDWAGLACYDLIFPTFVFLAGVSTVFSLSRIIAQHGRAEAVKRILLRMTILFLLGIEYSGGLTNAWPNVRLLGVLQRIAFSYAGAGLLFCFLKPRALVAAFVALLVGYWALLTFVPIRNVQLEKDVVPKTLHVEKPTIEQVHQLYDNTKDYVTGKYEPGLNLTNHIDFQYLPGRLYDTYWDPEGILSNITGVATALMGIFAGLWLRRTDKTGMQKVAGLALAGGVALALGWTWHLQFPVVKKIWTSSFVLAAGGWSLLLLALFYWIVDVREKRAWCQPFVWIGMNPITLYLIGGLVNYLRVGGRFVGASERSFLDAHVTSGLGAVAQATMGLFLMFALARFLYRREIFLRV